MNPNEFVHNTAYSVQLPYIAGHFLSEKRKLEFIRLNKETRGVEKENPSLIS